MPTLFYLLQALLVTASAFAQTVTTPDGVTYKGGKNKAGQTYYRRIRFAKPPTGPLRFKPPQPPVTVSGSVVEATEFGPTCHQVSSSQSGQSEDCLHLNILQPASLKPGERLPVIFYVFGASFKGGDSSSYEKGALLAAGDKYGQRAIWIAVNYRLSAYGFLVGQGAQDMGYTNVGILDQRAGLEWVQKNVAAFGGDPGRVILAGQSAGAISAASHLLRPGGTFGLFHGVFLISGSVPTIGIGGPALRQYLLDELKEFTNCNKNSAAAVFACMEAMSESDFHVAVRAVAGPYAYSFAPQIDSKIIPGDPSALIKGMKIAKVPLVLGNTLDEGTSPTMPSIDTTAEVKTYVNYYSPLKGYNKAALNNLIKLYSKTPSAGSPYNTGSQTYTMGRLGKQAASVLGDLQFAAPRRWLAIYATKQAPVYNYLWAEKQRDDPVGVRHGSDLGYWLNASGKMGAVMSKALLNFANNLDPNGKGVPKWPTYGSAGNSLQLKTKNTTVISDDFRARQIGYINARPASFLA